MKDVIKVQKLSKSYGGKTAVAEVSLTVSGGNGLWTSWSKRSWKEYRT